MKCITGKICYKDRLDAIIALSRIQEKTKKLYKKEWHYPIRARIVTGKQIGRAHV